MRRRTLLRRSAALGTIAMAGCMANGDDNPDDGDGNGTPTGGDTDAPTDDPTGTPPPGPTGFGDTAVETTNTGCAGEDGAAASVSFDADGISIGIDGVLQASDPCHVASFESTRYRPDEMVLEVTIAAKPEDTEGMCQQCLGAIEYEATVGLEGGLPATVVVMHGTGEDATQVARVSRD